MHGIRVWWVFECACVREWVCDWRSSFFIKNFFWGETNREWITPLAPLLLLLLLVCAVTSTSSAYTFDMIGIVSCWLQVISLALKYPPLHVRENFQTLLRCSFASFLQLKFWLKNTLNAYFQISSILILKIVPQITVQLQNFSKFCSNMLQVCVCACVCTV